MWKRLPSASNRGMLSWGLEVTVPTAARAMSARQHKRGTLPSRGDSVGGRRCTPITVSNPTCGGKMGGGTELSPAPLHGHCRRRRLGRRGPRHAHFVDGRGPCKPDVGRLVGVGKRDGRRDADHLESCGGYETGNGDVIIHHRHVSINRTHCRLRGRVGGGGGHACCAVAMPAPPSSGRGLRIHIRVCPSTRIQLVAKGVLFPPACLQTAPSWWYRACS